MGCAPSRQYPNYYDQYFQPAQTAPHRSHRIANIDRCEPSPDYQDYLQKREQDVAAARYEDAYDQLTARSKLSKAHGLQAYCEDRGWK